MPDAATDLARAVDILLAEYERCMTLAGQMDRAGHRDHAQVNRRNAMSCGYAIGVLGRAT